MPHLVPISPQWRMYCFCNPVSSAISVISVETEYTENAFVSSGKFQEYERWRSCQESLGGVGVGCLLGWLRRSLLKTRVVAGGARLRHRLDGRGGHRHVVSYCRICR